MNKVLFSALMGGGVALFAISLLLASAEAIPDPPVFTATDTTYNSVKLTWTATGNFYFLYQDDVDIGPLDTGGQIHGTTYTATGLTPNTAYEFRIVAYDDGLSLPRILTITTPHGPPTLESGTITPTSITIEWDAVTGATEYKLFRDGNLIKTGGDTSYTETGLTPATTYRYHATATSAAGTSDSSDVLTVSTSAPTEPPAPPTLESRTITKTSIELRWNEVFSATGYELFRNGESIRSGDFTSYVDRNLVPGTIYRYHATATNAAGISDSSDVLAITTEPEPPTLVAGTVTDTSVIITWESQTGAAEYLLFQDGSLIETVTGTTHTVTGLSTGTSYSFTAKSRASDSTESSLSSALPVATLPAPPTLTEGDITPTSIELRWNEVFGATGYELFRDDVRIRSGDFTSYVDKNLVRGTLYTYHVTATSAAGTSDPSHDLARTTEPGPPILVAGTITDTSVVITWSAHSSVFDYLLYRNGIQIETVTGTTHTVTGLSPGTTYSFTGESRTHDFVISSLSSALSVTTLPVPPTLVPGAVTDTSITLSWNSVKSATSYTLTRVVEDGPNHVVVSDDVFTATDDSLEPGTNYNYIITATNSAGTSEDSEDLTVTTPAAPIELVAGEITPTSIKLTWTAVEGTVGYALVRSDSSTVVVVGNTSHTFTDLTPETVYIFSVLAADAFPNLLARSANLIVATSSIASPDTPAEIPPIASGSFSVIAVDDGTASASFTPLKSGDFTIGYSTDQSINVNIADTVLGVKSTTTLPVESDYSGIVTLSFGGEVIGSVSVTTLPAPPVLVLGEITPTSVVISWDAVTGATGYELFRDDASLGTVTGTSYSDTAVTPGTSYTYHATSTNAAGTSDASVDLVAVTTIAPSVLSAGEITDTSIVITWTAPTGATEYSLFNGNTLVIRTSALTHTVDNLTAETDYTFTITSHSDTYTGVPSEDLDVTTAATPVPPETPVLSVDSTTDTTVTLSWGAVENADSYTLSRTGGAGPAEIPVSGGNTISYTDENLEPDTDYKYTITATNSVETSDSSAEVAATTTAASVLVPNAPTYTLDQTAIEAGSLSYQLNTAGDKIHITFTPLQVGSYTFEYDGRTNSFDAEDTHINKSQVLPNIPIGYGYDDDVVVSFGGTEVARIHVTTLVAPLAAPVLSVGAITDTSIALSWGAVTGATHYNVYRDGIAQGRDIGVTSFADTGLTPGTEYAYHVIAFNGLAASASSNVESVTTTGTAPDDIAPSITVNEESFSIELGETYTAFTFTATDNIDGDISSGVTVGGDTVDTGTVGAYDVTFDVDDAAGNPAETVTRTVTVTADVTAPSITVNEESFSVELGGTYELFTFTANDNTDGIITGEVAVAGYPADTDTAGTYDVTFDVNDAAGNPAETVTRTVTVTDTTPPVITPAGSTQRIELTATDTYTEQGGTVTDNDPAYPRTVAVSGDTPDTSSIGVYTVLYDAPDDAAGNTPDQQSIVISVVDTTPPTFDVDGNTVDYSTTVPFGGTYTQGVINNAFDISGIASSIVGGETVNVNASGEYVVTYTVTDNNGLSAIITETVTVEDPFVISVGAITDTSIALSWTSVTDATYYKVYRDGRPQGGNIAGTTHIDTVFPGTTYRYHVTAFDGAGVITSSNVVSATSTGTALTTPPAAPVLSVDITLDAIIFLSWTAVGNADSYTLTRIVDGGNDVIVLSGTSGLSTDDDSLLSGTEYKYFVTATNTFGESVRSNTVTATTTGTASIDTTPPVITVTPEEITLELNSPAPKLLEGVSTDDGSEINTSGTVDVTTVGDYTITYSSTDGTNPAVGKTRIYKVIAATAPPATPALGIASNTHNTIELAWVAVANAETYTLTRIVDGGDNVVVESGDILSATDRNLTPSTNYKYVIVATNTAGTSDPSAEFAASTTAAPVETPAIKTGSFEVTHTANADKLLVTFTALKEGTFTITSSESSDTVAVSAEDVSDSAVKESTITVGYDFDGDVTLSFDSKDVASQSARTLAIKAGTFIATARDDGDVTVSFVPLRAGTFLIQAVGGPSTLWTINTDEVGNATENITLSTGHGFIGEIVISFGGHEYARESVSTIPGTPTLVKGDITHNSVVFSWDAQTGATGYTLSRTGGTGPTEIAVTGTSYDDTLEPETTYTYSIRAVSIAGDSAASDVVSVTTLAAPTVAPTVPEIPVLSVDSTTDTTISLSWGTVGNANSYTLSRTLAGSAAGTETLSGDATTFTDENLTADTEYKYTLIATNSVGSSEPSNEVTASTDSSTYTLTSAPHTDGDKVTITFTSSHTGNFVIEFENGSTINFPIDDAATPNIHTETVGYDYTGNVIISIAGGVEVARESVTTGPAPDDTAPSITVNKDSFSVELGETYVPFTYSATDDTDGDITGKVVVGDTVDTSIANTYTVTFDVDDAAGNSAVTVTRTVTVTDNTPPSITPTGSTQRIELTATNTYTEQGATVTDNDPNYSETVTVSGNTPDTRVVGVYTVLYDAPDDAANNTPDQKSIVITVSDTTPPTFDVDGNTVDYSTAVPFGETYTQGVINNAFDISGIASSIVGGETVNVNASGEYVVTYTVTDSNGQTTTITETVTVGPEPTAPAAPILSAGATTDTTISLSWVAVENADSYTLSRTLGNNPAVTVLLETNVLTTTDENLEPDTDYKYTITATNSVGTSDSSAEVAARTDAATPPAAPALRTGEITSTSIVIAWDIVTGATGYELFRDGNSVTTTTELFYTDETLTPATSYTYHATATNSAGTSEDSANRAATTARAHPLPAPPVLVKGAINSTSIVISWDAQPNAHFYKLYRDDSLIRAIFGLSYTDTGLDPYTSYTYHATSTNRALQASDNSEDLIAVTTIAPPTLRPGAITPTSIVIEWTASTGATGYELFRDDASLGTVTGTSYSDNIVTPGTSYTYHATSTNAAETSVPSEDLVAVTTIAPPTLRPGAITPTSIVIAWDIVEGATGYELFRDDASLGPVTGTSYSDNIVTPGTSYTYHAISTNDIPQTSDNSADLEISTTIAPPELVAGAITETSIVIEWTAPTGATGYELFRDDAFLETVTALSYTDTGLTPETIYIYHATSTNDISQTSEPSANLVVSTRSTATPGTPIAIPPIVSDSFGVIAGADDASVSFVPLKSGNFIIGYGTDQRTVSIANDELGETSTTIVPVGYNYDNPVTLSFDGAQVGSVSVTTGPAPPVLVKGEITPTSVVISWGAVDGVTEYELFRDDVSLGPVTELSYTDNMVTPGTSYTYHATSTNAAGTSVPSEDLVAVTTIAPPATPVLVLGEVTETSITLSWVKVDNADSYTLTRIVDGINDVTVISGDILTATDTGLIVDADYNYIITATNSAGPSAPSAKFAASTTAASTDTVLAAPTLRAVEITESSIEIEWSKVTGAVLYSLFRNGVFIEYAFDTSYTDTGLTPETIYIYHATSSNAASQQSGKSADLVVSTRSTATPGTPIEIPAIESGSFGVIAGADDASVSFVPLKSGNFIIGYGTDQRTVSIANDELGETSTTIVPVGYNYDNPVTLSFGGVEVGSVSITTPPAPDTTAPDTTAPDTTAPSITVNEDSFSLELGETYTAFTYSATDNTDGDITSGVVVGGDTVDIGTVGTYDVTFDVDDAAGNHADTVTRTVTVTDTTAPAVPEITTSPATVNTPSFTIDGTAEAGTTVALFNGATPAGTATADGSGNFSFTVTLTDGENSFTVTASDGANTSGPSSALVITLDTEKPVITVTGSSETIELTQTNTYTIPDATVEDNDPAYSETVAVTGNTPDTSSIGEYTVLYDAPADAAGNTPDQKSITITVSDTTAPTLTVERLANNFIRLSWENVPSVEGAYIIHLDTGGSQSTLAEVFTDSHIISLSTDLELANAADRIGVTGDTGTQGTGSSFTILYEGGTVWADIPAKNAVASEPPVLVRGAVTDTSIVISWDIVDGATGYELFRDDVSIATTTTELSHTDDELTPGKSYTYHATATNSAGPSDASKDLTAATTIAPPVLVKGAVTDTTVIITWTAIHGAADYLLYQDNSATPIATVTGTTHTVTGLTAGTDYSFAAESRSSDSVKSSPSSALPVLTVPAAPALGTGAITDTSIVITWDIVEGATGYKLFRDDVSIATTTTELSHTDTTVTPGKFYTYHATATNSAGSSEDSDDLDVATTLAAPVLELGEITGTSVTITWTAIHGAADYFLHLEGLRPITVIGTTHTYINLTPGTTYSFTVESYNSDRTVKSQPSVPLSVTTSPATPTLRITDTAHNTITLSWDRVGADSYTLTRIVAGGANVLVPTTDALTATDTGLTAETPYRYVITATNAAGTSGSSNEVTASTAAAPAPATPTLVAGATTDTTITLSWGAVDYAKTYTLTRTVGIETTEIPDITGTSYTDGNLEPATDYNYIITATNSAGTSTPSAEFAVSTTAAPTDTTIPETPTLLLGAVTPTSITLSWNSVNNAETYTLTRVVDSINDVTVASGDILTATDENLIADTEYNYIITSTTPEGKTSAPSAEFAVTISSAAQSFDVAADGDEISVFFVPTISGEFTIKYGDQSIPVTIAAGDEGSASTTIVSVGYNFNRTVALFFGSDAIDSIPINTEPAPPTIRATTITPTSILIVWEESTGAQEYKLYKNNIPIATTPDVSYTDDSLEPETIYIYHAESHNDISQTSDTSANLVVSTSSTASPGTPIEIPAIQEPFAIETRAEDVLISFVPLKSGDFIIGYGTDQSITVSITNDELGETSSTLVPVGYNYNGDITLSFDGAQVDSLSITTSPAPPSLRVGAVTPTSITIEWDAVDGAIGYLIYDDPTVGHIRLNFPTELSFYIPDLTPETSYTYYVRSVNPTGIGDGIQGSEFAELTTRTADAPTVPATPVLSVDSTTDTTVSLSWGTVGNANSYTLTRTLAGSAAGTEALSGDATTFTDENLTADTEYKYTLIATNSVGPSEPSNEVTASTDSHTYTLTSAPHTDGDKVTITFTSSHTGNFVIEFENGSTINFRIGDASIPNIHIETVGYDYTGNVIILIAGGAEVARESVTTGSEPAPGFATLVLGTTTHDTITLSWEAVDNVDSYTLTRVVDGSANVVVFSGNALTAIDENLDADTEYKYVITATNTAGTSTSLEFSARTSTQADTPAIEANSFEVTNTANADTLLVKFTALKEGTFTITSSESSDTVAVSAEDVSGSVEKEETITVGFVFDDIVTLSLDGETVASKSARTLAIRAGSFDTTANADGDVEVSFVPLRAGTFVIQAVGGPSTNWTINTDEVGGIIPVITLLTGHGFIGDVVISFGGHEYARESISTVPGTPALTAAIPTHNSVVLSWDAQTSATGYTLSRTGGTGSIEIPVTGTSYADTLEPETAYTYSIRAVALAGEGASSNVVSVTTPAAPATEAFFDVAISLDHVLISFVPLKSGDFIIRYDADQSITVSIADGELNKTSSTVVPVGVNYDGDVSLSFGGVQIGSLSIRTAPAAPVLRVGEITPTSVVIEWDPVDGAIGYLLYTDPNAAHIDSNAITELSFDITGLTPGTSYTYYVRSVNPTGIGDGVQGSAATRLDVTTPTQAIVSDSFVITNPAAADTLLVTFTALQAGTFTITAGTLTDTVDVSAEDVSGAVEKQTTITVGFNFDDTVTLSFDSRQVATTRATTGSNPDAATTPAPPVLGEGTVTHNSIVIEWTAPTGATEYKLYRTDIDVPLTTTTELSYTDNIVTPGTSYTYRAISTNAVGGASAFSEDLIVSTPLAPIELVAGEITPTSIEITWTVVDGTVVYSLIRSDSSQIVGVGGTSHTFTDLTPETVYTYSVVAFDGVPHVLARSADLVTATTAAAPTVPETPTLEFADATLTSITLSWVAVNNAESYTVTRIVAGGNVDVPTTGLTATDTGLTADTPYKYTITATNSAGTSDPSDEFPARTDTAPDIIAPPVPAITTPPATVSSSPITIDGTAEIGSTVELFRGGTSVDTTTVDGSGNFSFTAELTEGANSFTVTASDGPNTSAASPAVVITLDTTPAGGIASVTPGTETPKKKGGDSNEWKTKPTFGKHWNNQAVQLVDDGFVFNGMPLTITNNWHTDFNMTSSIIGDNNTVHIKGYATNGLKSVSLSLGVPEVGLKTNAESHIIVNVNSNYTSPAGYDIADIVHEQKEGLVNQNMTGATISKVKCTSSDTAERCFDVTISFVIMAPLSHEVLAINAVDKQRYSTTTYINEGVEFTGEALLAAATHELKQKHGNQNPFETISLTQQDRRYQVWEDQYGYIWSQNDYGTWLQITRPDMQQRDDSPTSVMTRIHSNFASLVIDEQDRATLIFDSKAIQGTLDESFSYDMPLRLDRVSDLTLLESLSIQEMLAQEMLCDCMIYEDSDLSWND